MKGERPVRVLHVIGRMDRGGVETWLMHVLRSIDRAGVACDFLVHTDAAAAFDEEILDLGGRLLALPSLTRSLRYGSRFRAAIRELEPYDIVHSHVHHFSGLVLRAAAQAGVAVRIAHSHSDTSLVQADATLPRRAYLRITESLIRRHGTLALAVTRDAGRSLYPWAQDDRQCPWQVLHYGIALDPFIQPADRAAVRHELGIDSEALVIGHVGNFNPVKNHALLIDAFAAVIAQRLKSILLLVGEGPLRGELERQVAARGLGGRVIFAGVRADVPRLLAGAVDVFAFPSLWEGLPLAVIEAQAAGLPIVMSDRVSSEVDIIAESIHRLPVTAGPEAWARLCLRVCDRKLAPDLAYRRVAASSMNIKQSVNTLLGIYRSGESSGRRHAAA
jgi:glycosyltransferase involved in cell wall biosynthesis